jgi:integrase
MSTPKRRKKNAAKRLLALPDLEHAKIAVLNSLTSASGQRTYEHAIREFVAWYCSEPRLAFNRTVVLRYPINLEQRRYAPATINLRLAAVRRIAYEAADAGLLSPNRAGIRRERCPTAGRSPGNWLTAEQAGAWCTIGSHDASRTRDHAMVALLLGCGLRRGEALGLALESIQQRRSIGSSPTQSARGATSGRSPCPVGEDRRRRLDPSRRTDARAGLSRDQQGGPGGATG